MKTFYKICIGTILFLTAVVIGITLPIKWYAELEEVALFTPIDGGVWNRIFDVINAILLLLTLLTAIFKEQILAKIYCAKFEIDKNSEYDEIVENKEGGSIANTYEKLLSVQNVGNRSAINCKLILDQVSIKCESDYYETKINVKETVIIPQSEKFVGNQLRPRGTFLFSMFRILPKVAAHDEITERPMLFLIGNNEIQIIQGKTDYIIAFHVEAEDIQSSTSKMIIHWNGKWQNRKTEMMKVLSIEYLE